MNIVTTNVSFAHLLQDVKEWYISRIKKNSSMLSQDVWIFFKASVHHTSNLSYWDVTRNVWLNFQAAAKFGIVAVRLILPKVEIDGFTGLTGKWCRIKKWFLKRQWFTIACDRLILGKVGLDGYTGPGHETDDRYKFGFKVILKGLVWK